MITSSTTAEPKLNIHVNVDMLFLHSINFYKQFKELYGLSPQSKS